MCHIVGVLDPVPRTKPRKMFKIFIEDNKGNIRSPMFGTKRRYERGKTYERARGASQGFNSFPRLIDAKRYIRECNWVAKKYNERFVIRKVYVSGRLSSGTVQAEYRGWYRTMILDVVVSQYMRVGNRVWSAKTTP